MIEKLTLYQKIYDLYLYTHKAIKKFPKSERFLISLGLQNALSEAIKSTVRANGERDAKKRQSLQKEIEAHLEIYTTNLRLSHDLNLLSGHKYGVASKHLEEIFRILYGWKKRSENNRAITADHQNIEGGGVELLTHPRTPYSRKTKTTNNGIF